LTVKEQVSFCVRFCNEKLEIKEKFLGFYETEKTSGESLLGVVKKCLSDSCFDFANIVGQCYDGASNMKGEYKGLAASVRLEAPTALYIHCYAHRLNLALQDSCDNIKEVRNTLGQVNSVYNLIEGSSKRNYIFEKFQLEHDKSKLTLKNFCETRWSSRFNALKAANENYETILETLKVNFRILSSKEKFKKIYLGN